MTSQDAFASTLVLRPLLPTDHETVIDLWRRARRAAFTYNAFQMSTTAEDDAAFFAKNVIEGCEVWVASSPGMPVGFVALRESKVEHLFVAPEAQSRGVGTSLLLKAMIRCPEGVSLKVFQKNDGARRFYERHGFVAGEMGTSPAPEAEPDIEYSWRPEH